MMAKVNAKRKSRKDTVKEKSVQFYDVPITDVPLTEALVLRKRRDYLRAPIFMTNVPHLVAFYSESGYTFGYHGKGPLDLALNVCEWYLLQAGYLGARTSRGLIMKCEQDDYFEMSLALHRDFHAAFIEKVPEEGITVPFAELKEWFDDHL